MTTMAHQVESLSSLDQSGNTNLKPSTPTTSEEVPASSAEERIATQEAVDRLFISMFDDYVSTMHSPDPDYSYVSGFHDQRAEDNPYGNPVPLYKTLSHEELMRIKLHNLEKYTEGSIDSGNLEIDASFLPKEGPVSFDQLRENFVYAYVSQGISKAMDRYEGKSVEYPAHISVEAPNTDLEATNKFIEVIRHLGTGAIQAIYKAHTLFSGPVDVTPPEARIHEAAAYQPAEPKNLTGDVLTVRLSKVKL